jgi:hypothetical protein
LFLLASVLDLDSRLAILVDDFEGVMLHVRLHLSVNEFTTDETLGVENTIDFFLKTIISLDRPTLNC